MPPLPTSARVAKELQTTFESLRTLSSRLNTLTDQANETVRLVEEFLNEECSIGIATFVKVSGDDESSAGIYLEYRRHGGKFRIAVVEADSDGEDRSVKAWADCTRTQKLELFKHLPELLTQIAAKADAEIQETDAAAKVITATLNALRKQPS